MKHNVSLEGYAYALRPIERADAGLIVALRADPVHTRFLHPIEPSVASQEAYLDRYFERANDYYFVVIRRQDGAADGLIGLYDLDPEDRSAEWGRWVLKPGSLAAVESALLIYRIAFEKLDLRTVYCRTIVENRSVVSFHDSCGLVRRQTLPGHFHLNGVAHDCIEHVLQRSCWLEVEPLLVTRVKQLGRWLERKARDE